MSLVHCVYLSSGIHKYLRGTWTVLTLEKTGGDQLFAVLATCKHDKVICLRFFENTFSALKLEGQSLVIFIVYIYCEI